MYYARDSGLLFIWLSSYYMATSCLGQNQNLTHYSVTNDVTIQSVMTSQSTVSPLQCYILCSKNANCYFFSFAASSKQCVLHAYETPNLASPAVGFNLYSPFAECDQGWIVHIRKCYFLEETAFNWYDARTNCQSYGGDLVKFDDTVENGLIETAARAQNGGCYWIGGRYFAEHGGIRWYDLTTIDFHDFFSYSTSMASTGCMDLVSNLDYRWNVHWDCINQNCLSICEKDAV